MRPSIRVLCAVLTLGLAPGCGDPPTGSDTGVPPATDAGAADEGGRDGGRDAWIDPRVDANVDAPSLVDAAVVPVIDVDRDDDGIPDDDDALPDDPHEVYDDDGDGIGNLADPDEDGDGVPDTTDLAPFDAAASDYPEEHEVEPNDVPPEATAATRLPVRITGALDTVPTRGGDVDAISVPVSGGGGVTFVVRGAAGARIDFQESTHAIRFPMAEHALADGARVITILVDEGPAVIVIDDTRSTTGRAAWTVEAYRDDDLDGLDDARERARGVRAPDPDSDDDGLGDFDEWDALDPDADGFPAVLDADADGDGIVDGAEELADDDGDGMPSFLDLDSDGVAPDDATLAAHWPDDLDADGRPDFRDLDDDGDGLRDDADADPTTPLATPTDPTSWIVVTALETEMGADRAPNALVPGELLRIEGTGLGALATTRLVFDVGGARPISATPESVTSTLVVVRVPAHVQTGVFRVVDGSRASDVVSAEHVDVAGGEPLLFAQTTLSTVNVEYLRGVHLDQVVSVVADGAPTTTTPSQLATTGFQSGTYRVETLAGRSNAITLLVTFDRTVYVTLPGATPARWAALRVSSLVGDGAVTGVGSYRVPILVGGDVPFVVASTVDGRGPGHDCVTLEGYGDIVDPTSTATALAVQYANLLEAVAPPSRSTVVSNVAALPEIVALASILSARLASTTCPLDAPDTALMSAIVAAMNAADADVRTRLAMHTLEPPDRASHPPVVLPIRRAIVTPPETFDVQLYQRQGTGHLTLENDTSLSLSARMVTTRGGVVVRHIGSYFDPLVVGPQSGLLTGYRANTQDYEAPNYRSVTVEVVTPGHGLPQPTTPEARDAQWTLAVRSAVEGMFIPLIDEMIPGGHLDAGAFAQLLVQQNYMAVQDLRGGWQSGGVTGFLGGLGSILVRDFDNFGPVTQYLATTLGRRAVGAVLRRLSERIVTWLIPILGQAEAFFELVSLGGTASNMAAMLDDFARAPGRMEFDVDFGLSLDSLEPSFVERADRPVRVRMTGTGFLSLDTIAHAQQPFVTVNDLGGTSARVLPATASSNGTELTFDLPGAFLRSAVGGLSVRVTSGLDTEAYPRPIEVGQLLRLRSVTPETVGPSERIVLEGAGFGATARDASVWFESAEHLVRRGRITSHSPSRIEAITHYQLEEGTSWEVHVEVDGVESNHLPLNVQPLDLDAWLRGTSWRVTNFWGACGEMRVNRFVAVFAPRPNASGIFYPAETWGGYESGNFYAYDASQGYRMQGNDLDRRVWLGGRISYTPVVGAAPELTIGVRDGLIFLNDWFPFSYRDSEDLRNWPPPAISLDHRTVRWFHTNSYCVMPDRAEMTR